jgi:hypothetical protein
MFSTTPTLRGGFLLLTVLVNLPSFQSAWLYPPERGRSWRGGAGGGFDGLGGRCQRGF